MKHKIFLILSIVFALASLAFLGVTFYWLHFIIWNSIAYASRLIPFFLLAFFLMGGALIFFNFSRPKLAMRITVNIVLGFLITFGLPIDLGIENISFDSYTSFTPEKWQTIEDEYKYYTAESFLDKYDVNEMKMSEVIELLGEPYSQGEALSTTQVSLYRYSYYCGIPTNILATDPYFLDLYTRESGTDSKIVYCLLGER